MRDFHTLVAAILFAFLCAASGYVIGRTSQVDDVRLVGYGCAGASGPIYAAEEDHFPSCVKIERI